MPYCPFSADQQTKCANWCSLYMRGDNGLWACALVHIPLTFYKLNNPIERIKVSKTKKAGGTK